MQRAMSPAAVASSSSSATAGAAAPPLLRVVPRKTRRSAASSSSLQPPPRKLPAARSFLSPPSSAVTSGAWVLRPHRRLCHLRDAPEGSAVVARATAAEGQSESRDAAATEEEEEEESGSGRLTRTVELGALFALWYLFNIYFNIYNKQVLKVYQFPLTISTFQFALGSVIILLMWIGNVYKKPKVSTSQLLAIIPLAILHTLGNVFTNMSLGRVAVSFTHTIKAMEPFFSVVLSAIFLEELPTLWVLTSLVPIVGGVALASLSEASFNWVGFWSAMASNLTNQSRNVVSKKLMVKKEESLDNITLFSLITVMSFFLLAPVTLIVEGIKFTPTYVYSAGLNLKEIYVRSLLAGLCFHAYQQVSYMILALVSPVTHSVGNCVKRVVVIVSSVLFFRTPVSLINSLGTGIALAGVFLYSRVKRLKPKSA